MSLADTYAEELKVESEKTRSLLECLPEAYFDWRPHEKSMSLKRLGCHLVEVVGLADKIVNSEELALDNRKPFDAANRAEILREFDERLAAGMKALAGRSDEDLAPHWKLTHGGMAVVDMPRSAAIRYIVLNHTIHHRGQLDVYLRLKDVPLPSIYGPTADTRAAS